MSGRAELMPVLSRVRRRLRLVAAARGAVLGAWAGLATATIYVAMVRGSGEEQPVSVAIVAGAVATSIGLGAVGRALRRIPLSRCARALDGAVDGDGPRHDRVLSALSFVSGVQTPFSRAAVADAVVRGAALTPGEVVPLRRPGGLLGVGVAALALTLAFVVPVPGARGTTASVRTAGREAAQAITVDPVSLDAEREEARAAALASAALKDDALAALSRALTAALSDLAKGTLPRGETLDALAALERRADELATDAEVLAGGLRRAGATMRDSDVTSALGRALEASDPATTQRALDELAARALDGGAETRARLAQALADAAAAGQASGANGSAAVGGGAGAEASAQRRLARQRKGTSAANGDGGRDQPAGRAGDRQLQRLRRELSEMAEACRAAPDSCRRKLQDGARELPRMENEARSSDARRRLSQAVKQLRERLRRDSATSGNRQRSREERRFSRAARGQSGAAGKPGGEQPGDQVPAGDQAIALDEAAETVGMGGDDDATPGAASGTSAEGEATAAGDAPTGDEQARRAAAAQGEGAGSQAGGDPFGARTAPSTGGRKREAQVRSGAGPTRAQIIEAAAEQGFARGSYRDTFTEYEAVVEESLDASAVPPGRRYVVRRYFQLIRPRAAAGSKTPTSQGAASP